MVNYRTTVNISCLLIGTKINEIYAYDGLIIRILEGIIEAEGKGGTVIFLSNNGHSVEVHTYHDLKLATAGR